MPDWFYRTVSRPLLFRLSAIRARNVALGFMGRLARLPFGGSVIDFMGHMRADPRLHCSFLGIDFPTSVGLGPGLDGNGVALPALARFGFGFLEIGPVSRDGGVARLDLERRPGVEAIWFPDPAEHPNLQTFRPRVREAAQLGLPLIIRIGCAPSQGAVSAARECRELIEELTPYAALFSLDTFRMALAERWPPIAWADYLRAVLPQTRPVLLSVPADADPIRAEPLLDMAIQMSVGGLLLDGSIAVDSGRLIGQPARPLALEAVRRLRLRYGKELFLVGSGGIHDPEDALAFRRAGANLVQVDSGLVYTGPGLPKRINEALLYQAVQNAPTETVPDRPTEMTWFWTTLMGAGMLLGSFLALVIAATRVVLPYDEAFLGMSREQLAGINPRLLDFMTHDRVSLAGTMIAVGVMYLGLSLFGIRQGLHWVQQSVLISAFTGFASFFLFLGFGYLDTFHAFVTAIMFQFLLLAVHSRLGSYSPRVAPPLRGDTAWLCSLWGQFLLVIHGFALLGAGTVISTVGVTEVFVLEDLEFMHTTAEALKAANPRLVPLIAHDRATFGGMLLAAGWVFLLPALWGFRNGSAWLWWTYLIAGVLAYTAAIGVHLIVGYTDVMHLLPAFGGLSMFLLALGLSRSYLCGTPPEPESARLH